jgi:hypothetical protein
VAEDVAARGYAPSSSCPSWCGAIRSFARSSSRAAAPAILIYIGLSLLIARALFEPWLLALFPALLVAPGVQPTRTVDPRKLAAFCVLLHLPRMLVMSAALLYGSIRFRCLVL